MAKRRRQPTTIDVTTSRKPDQPEIDRVGVRRLGRGLFGEQSEGGHRGSPARSRAAALRYRGYRRDGRERCGARADQGRANSGIVDAVRGIEAVAENVRPVDQRGDEAAAGLDEREPQIRAADRKPRQQARNAPIWREDEHVGRVGELARLRVIARVVADRRGKSFDRARVAIEKMSGRESGIFAELRPPSCERRRPASLEGRCQPRQD